MVCQASAWGAAAPPERPRKSRFAKGCPVLGMTPDTTALDGGIIAPHSAMPAPSLDVGVVALHLDGREDQRAPPHRRYRVVGSELPQSAWCALARTGKMVDAMLIDHRNQQRMIRRVRAPVIRRIVKEGVAQTKRRVECLHRHAIRSGPDRTWIGRLSAAANKRWSAVTMQHEKSRAMFNTPDRPVRNSVLAIFCNALQPVAEDGKTNAIAYRFLHRLSLPLPSCPTAVDRDHMPVRLARLVGRQEERGARPFA